LNIPSGKIPDGAFEADFVKIETSIFRKKKLIDVRLASVLILILKKSSRGC